MASFTLLIDIATDGQNLTLSIPFADLADLFAGLAVAGAVNIKPATSNLINTPARDSATLTLRQYSAVCKGKAWVVRNLHPWTPGASPEDISLYLDGELVNDSVRFVLTVGEIYYAHAPRLSRDSETNRMNAKGTIYSWDEYYVRVDVATGEVEKLSRQQAQAILEPREEESAEQSEDGGGNGDGGIRTSTQRHSSALERRSAHNERVFRLGLNYPSGEINTGRVEGVRLWHSIP